MQFSGFPSEDPNQHLIDFLETCDLVKFKGVKSDAIRLRLFKYSLRDKARSWLQSLEAGSITTWDELKKAFLQRYFSMAKSAKLRNDISGFRQLHDEPLYEAWERYKDLLRRYPQHQLPKWMIVKTFYNGLHGNTQTMIDAAAGGSMNNKKPAEVYELIEAMASNNYERGGDHQRKNAGVLDVDEMTSLKAKLAAMQKQMARMQVNAAQVPMLVCELCAGGHATQDCQVGNTFG